MFTNVQCDGLDMGRVMRLTPKEQFDKLLGDLVTGENTHDLKHG